MEESQDLQIIDEISDSNNIRKEDIPDVDVCDNCSEMAEIPSKLEIFEDTDTICPPTEDVQIDNEVNNRDSVSNENKLNFETEVQPIIHNFETVPVQITGAWQEFEGEPDNFMKGCKWSPDGSCLMTCSNDNMLRIFNFPSELCESNFEWENVKEMNAVLKVSEGELIYDYCWYPLMKSDDPVTSCFISTSRDSPIHMWDAFTGKLRCTYRPYNHLDEISAAYSVAFDSDGQNIYAGFNKKIRIFNVSVPGRKFTERPTYVKRSGQHGIISCFAFTSEQKHISAAGSYSKTIGIYAEPDGFLIDLLQGHSGGVTHLNFSPDGTRLYSGARMDPELLCWDLRNMNKILFSLRRHCDTNQRIYFDLSRCGKYLISGNCNGVITVWDVSQTPKVVPNSSNPIIQPIQFYAGHQDCVNGVSIHPTLPLLASSSGQRIIPNPVDSEDEQDSEIMFTDKYLEQENSLRLWWTANDLLQSEIAVDNKQCNDMHDLC